MAAITVRGVSKQFGTQIVLNDVSAEINTGETVGLVGANGAGKTTLFRLITGELIPDLGTVTIARDVEVGLLRQQPDIQLDRTLHDEVGSVFAGLLELEQKLHAAAEEMAAKAEHADLPALMDRYERLNAQFIAAGGHRFETDLNEILGGLGFSFSDYSRPMAVMSGGQRCRAALAKLLLQDNTMLLLDEPTNHLDIDAVRWLEKFLAGHHGGAVIISHDRYLLDRVCDRIVEVERGKLTSFSGNYTTYHETKKLRELTLDRQFEKDREFIEKERAFIAKHLAGQRTKEAQGRRTRLERRLAAGEFVTEATKSRRSAKLTFDVDEVREGTVIRCDDLGMRYGDLTLFDRLTLQIYAGQRLGITGPNGTGKTTLLKILLGQAAQTSGTFWIDAKRSVGYYAQDERYLDLGRTVLEEIRSVRPDLSEERARSILGAYLFTKEDVFKPLGALSGGEQSRVRLASLILRAPEVLILDEPTNHLDIPSREVLEESLDDFEGTIIAVSHDRYFLDRIVDRLLVIRPAGWRHFDGDYSFYVEQVERERAAAKAAPANRKKPGVKAASHAADTSSRRTTQYDHLSVSELEAMIIENEEALAALNEKFGDPVVLKDAAARAALQARIDETTRELAYLDDAWQERAAQA